MPSHKIHLAIASEINKELNLDLDELMLGSVLPDLTKSDHTESHYQNGDYGISGVANPDLFVSKYKKHFDNTFLVGYLCHLLTDKFYNSYMFTKFFIYEEDNDKEIGLRFLTGDELLNPDEIKEYKHRELELYDKWLLNNNKVVKFSSDECVKNIKDIDVASFDKKRLREYIKISNEDIDDANRYKILNKFYKYNFKLATKEELDKKYNECINYILKYLKMLNLIK